MVTRARPGSRKTPPRDREGAADTVLALAHALRTPVTALALGVGLLESGAAGALTGTQREIVTALARELERLRSQLDLALDTGHLGAYAGPVAREAVELGALVGAALGPLGPQASAQAVRVALAAPRPVRAMVDPAKITWVVASVAGSALRHSPRGATLRVRVTARGAQAEVRIEDEGPGLPDDVLAALRARRARGAPALTLAREIVEAHGGALAARNRAGGGCAVRIALPAAIEGGG